MNLQDFIIWLDVEHQTNEDFTLSLYTKILEKAEEALETQKKSIEVLDSVLYSEFEYGLDRFYNSRGQKD